MTYFDDGVTGAWHNDTVSVEVYSVDVTSVTQGQESNTRPTRSVEATDAAVTETTNTTLNTSDNISHQMSPHFIGSNVYALDAVDKVATVRHAWMHMPPDRWRHAPLTSCTASPVELCFVWR